MTTPITEPYYAVIFSSRRNKSQVDEYGQMSDLMSELAKTQPGYLGMESARDADGFGITVSYWRTPDDIKSWKQQSEHQIAQKFGRSHWYDSFHVRICKVEREYTFDSET